MAGLVRTATTVAARRELAPLAREGGALLVPGPPAQDHPLLGGHSLRVPAPSAPVQISEVRAGRGSVRPPVGYSRRLDGPAPPPPHRAARLRRRAAPGGAAGRAAASAAPRLTACPDPHRDFGCGTLSVPLDHAAAPGGERLRPALRRAQRRARPGGRLLIALSGGPGQASVDAASSFAASLQPALRRYRLVVLDQRGTGRRAR